MSPTVTDDRATERRAVVARCLPLLSPKASAAGHLVVDATGDRIEDTTSGLVWAVIELHHYQVLLRPVAPDGRATGPSFTLPIPAAPSVTESTSAFDAVAARVRIQAALDTLRTIAERTRRELRVVEADDETERARLTQQVPLHAVAADGRVLDPSAPLKQLGRSALTAATTVRDLRGEITTASALLAEVRTSLATAPRPMATSSCRPLDDVRSLDALGAVIHEKRAQWEYDYGECKVAADRLGEALAEVEGLMPRFAVVAQRHAVAAAQVLVEAHVALASQRLTQLRIEAERLRLPPEALQIASEALHLLDPALQVPRITWPRDPLGAPTLE
jgi:hypothetical protein